MRGRERGGAAREVLEPLTDEDCGLAYGRGDADKRVVYRVSVRANDRGDEGDEGQHVGKAGGVVLDAAGGQEEGRGGG